MRWLAASTTVLLLVAGPAPGQTSAITDACSTLTSDDARRSCNLVGNGILVVQPSVGVAAYGGNPVPGTASTLGMRLGTTPRLSVAGRLGLVRVEAPPILDRTRLEPSAFFLAGAGVDVTMGLFGGVSPAPTMGGVLSLDALARAGVLLLPTGDGFQDGTSLSWGLGTRLGLLRESFVFPGVSLSAMLHGMGDVTYGDPELAGTDAFFRSALRAWSLRAVVTKQIYLLGVTAGVGLDRYVSDTSFGLDAGGPRSFELDGLDVDRASAFVNVQWTMLILHLVAEVGWQDGPGEYPALLPGGAVEGGVPFGSLALRLSI